MNGYDRLVALEIDTVSGEGCTTEILVKSRRESIIELTKHTFRWLYSTAAAVQISEIFGVLSVFEVLHSPILHDESSFCNTRITVSVWP